VILVSYDSLSECEGMMLTVKAYSMVLGRWCEPILAVLVLFFAFATVICRAHYGRTALGYLTDRKIYHSIYMLLFSGSVFVGTVSAPDAVWTVADFALGAMTLLNVAVLWLMRREVREETCLLTENASVTSFSKL